MFAYAVSAVALLSLTLTALAETITLPGVLGSGTVTPEGISATGHIDWPKLSPSVNATSYDW